MARPSEGELQVLGPWPSGANNLARESSVPAGSFRRGVNVNVADDGKVSRRDGATKVVDAVEPTCLFGYGRRGFYVSGGALIAFDTDGNYHHPIATGFDSEGLVAHCLIEPDIYCSDGRSAVRISINNAVAPWSLETPSAPSLLERAGGSLEAGRYMVALTIKTPSGEESGLSAALTFDIEGDGSARIALPGGVSPNRWAIYMTKPNGTEFLLLDVVPGGATNVTINKQRLGRAVATESVEPMPPGQFAAIWNGRLLVATGAEVFWSEPMQYGYTRLAYNYASFSEAVTMLAAVDTAEGFFVGQESRTYFVRGTDPADSSLVEAYPAGVVPGSMTYVPGATLPLDNPPTQLVPMWTATNGVFCAGLPDGSILPMSETRYAARTGDQGAAAFVQKDGTSRYVATVRNPTDNDFAVGDSISGEVIRNRP